MFFKESSLVFLYKKSLNPRYFLLKVCEKVNGLLGSIFTRYAIALASRLGMDGLLPLINAMIRILKKNSTIINKILTDHLNFVHLFVLEV